jgi:hypothetical protein
MKSLWGLALICDIRYHLNYLSTKLQGQQKLIFDMFGAVRAFGMELKLCRKHLEDVNLCDFSFCDFVRKAGTICVLFATVRVLELIYFLSRNVKMRSMTFVAMVEVSFRTHSSLK